MARIVFAAHGLRSALNNTLALARQLVDAGHDVTVMSFRDVRADVEHVGGQFVWLQDGPDALRRAVQLRRRRGTVPSVPALRRLRKHVLHLEEPVELLRTLSPDLVVIDVEMHGVVMSARHLGMPALLHMTGHDPTRSMARPPQHRDMATGTSRADRLRVALAWADLLAQRRLRAMAGPLTRTSAIARVLPQQLNTPDLATLRSMARHLDIDLFGISSRHHWLEPITYEHLPLMSFTARELEFDPAASPGVIHVGPILDRQRRRRDNDTDDEETLVQFIDRFDRGDRRLAYCSMGSLQPANAEYYQRVIDAFEPHERWGLVIGLGEQRADVELTVATDRILLLEDAPQLDVLERSSVAIHPGGASTFYECLSFGVPSVIMHTGHVDMPGIAARTRHFGLGAVLDRNDADAHEIRAAADRLADGACAEALAWAQNAVATYGNGERAVELIESLAGAHHRHG